MSKDCLWIDEYKRRAKGRKRKRLKVMGHYRTVSRRPNGTFSQVEKWSSRNMSKCENCGNNFKLSNKDKFLRDNFTRVSSMVPLKIDVASIAKKAEGYCNKCWHEQLDPIFKDFI